MKHDDWHARRGRWAVEPGSKSHQTAGLHFLRDAQRKWRAPVLGDEHHAAADVEAARAADVSHSGADIVQVSIIDGEPGKAGALEHLEQLRNVRRFVALAAVYEHRRRPPHTRGCVRIERHASAILHVAQ